MVISTVFNYFFIEFCSTEEIFVGSENLSGPVRSQEQFELLRLPESLTDELKLNSDLLKYWPRDILGAYVLQTIERVHLKLTVILPFYTHKTRGSLELINGYKLSKHSILCVRQ